MDSKDETIEGLRQEIVKSVENAKKMVSLAVQLSADIVKKNLLIEKLQKEAKENLKLFGDACDEIKERSDPIYEEYRRALVTFGAEPEPLN